MSNVSFAALGLAEPLLRAVEAEGYTEPTPIQARTIPTLLQGRDLLGFAQTGTGKTAAFALPILQRLVRASASASGPSTFARLVLTPTRELAVQIATASPPTAQHLRLQLAHRASAASARPARCEALRRGVDILVATPGRLLDLIERRARRARAASRSSCSTRPTACSTWASSTTCAASSPRCPSSARRCCSRPPCPRRSRKLAARDPARTPCRSRSTPRRRTAEKIEQQRLLRRQARQARAAARTC